MSLPALPVAVLIDAQNISYTYAATIFAEVDKLGPASIRRAYANWSDPEAARWQDQLSAYAIQPMQCANVASKNAADMALIIDGMDLLHSGRYSGFCIVSSDSDFASFAVRVRQEGLKAFGFGQAKTPNMFRAACNAFTVLGEAKPVAVAAPAATVAGSPISLPSKERLSIDDINAIKNAIKAAAGTNGWSAIGAVGTHLKIAEFEMSKHAKKLSLLLRVCSFVEFKDNSGLAPNACPVRLIAQTPAAQARRQ